MPNETLQLQEALAQIQRLRTDVDNLSAQFFKNNFSSSQTFSKDIICTASFQLPSYSNAPSVGVVGQLIEVSGIAYICTVAGSVSSPATWTVIGTQV